MLNAAAKKSLESLLPNLLLLDDGMSDDGVCKNELNENLKDYFHH